MKNAARNFLVTGVFLFLVGTSVALGLPLQSGSRLEQKAQFQPKLLTRTVNVVNPPTKGSAVVRLKATELAPNAAGQGKLRMGDVNVIIEVRANGLSSPSSFGNQYQTFVVWAITAAGKPYKLGAVAPKGNKLELDTTSALRTLGLLITVEPYPEVTQPSEMVVLETAAENDTLAASCELLKGGYSPVEYSFPVLDTGSGYPEDVIHMYNARRIAQLAGAEGGDNYRRGDELFNSVVFSAQRQKKITTLMLKQAVNATQYFEAARAKALERQLQAQSK